MLDANTFANYSDAVLYVPTPSVNSYQNAMHWEHFGLILGMDFTDPGDVNGDLEVNVADINAVINLVLSGNGDTGGDVNGDGQVNIADINAIINLVLGVGK